MKIIQKIEMDFMMLGNRRKENVKEKKIKKDNILSLYPKKIFSVIIKYSYIILNCRKD
jgi:hypothetical protein